MLSGRLSYSVCEKVGAPSSFGDERASFLVYNVTATTEIYNVGYTLSVREAVANS